MRYGGAGIGYQLSSVFAGGPAPALATWLLHRYDSSLPIGIYIAACGVVTLIATALLPEPNRADGRARVRAGRGGAGARAGGGRRAEQGACAGGRPGVVARPPGGDYVVLIRPPSIT